jgi:hypothetical protein
LLVPFCVAGRCYHVKLIVIGSDLDFAFSSIYLTALTQAISYCTSIPTQFAMVAADLQQPPAQEPAAATPDYLTSPDAVLGDKDAKWRYGRAPDYSKTRKVFAESEYN